MIDIDDIREKDERDFWLSASEESLNQIWDNDEDEVYAVLLEC